MDRRPLRVGLLLAGLASLVVCVGFIDRANWATDLWPWEASRLSYIFLASILAAIAAPVIWIAISGELAAMQAGAVDLGITYGGALIYVLAVAGDPGQPALGLAVAVFAFGLVAMIATFRWTRGIAWIDPTPMPGLVRASFAAFAVILIGVGAALAFGADIFPWDLGAETSVLFGFIYLGAAAYFVCGVVVPIWSNAAGQLVGFLAYDLVLIGPFLDHFGEASGGQEVSLIIYTAFVLYSAGLAVYYLFISPQTRLRLGVAASTDPGSTR